MYQVSSRRVDEQPTLVMTAKLKVEEIESWIGRTYATVANEMSRLGVPFAGPPFARFRALDDQYAEFEVEAGFPVSAPVESEDPIRSSILPSGTVAVVTHIGPYDQMKPAYDAVEDWIEEQGGQPDGPAWEVFYSDPTEQPDPSTWRTEIYQPYR